jgi:hypothetical protein
MSHDQPVPDARRTLFTRIRGVLRALIVVGPDPAEARSLDDASALDTLLAWPIRLVIVVGAAVLGWVWSTTPAGVQLGWALQYALFAAVSVVTSFWFWILLGNAALAALWLVLSWGAPSTPPTTGNIWGFSDVVTWANRQVGHVEALAAWIAVAFVLSPCLTEQAGLLAAIGFLGGPLINGLARSRFFGGAKARESRAALMMERRSLIYLASLVGLTILALQAPHQLAAIIPLLLTVIPGISLRYWRFRRRKYLETTGDDGENGKQVRANRLKHAELQRQAARGGDIWVAATLVGAFFIGLVGLSLWARHHMEARNRTDQDGPPPPPDACVVEPGGPVEATLAVFVIADTQMHELGRRRFPGQMEVADTLVPVARRPVELDMLSTAAVVRFQSVFDRFAEDRLKANLAAPLWAHLGDFADLSCAGEMTRMVDLLHDYGCPGHRVRKGGDEVCSTPAPRNMAGVAPGNHDMSFQGNFGWSPYWDEACDERLDKVNSDAALAKLFDERLVPAGVTQRQTGWAPARFFGSTPTARFTVTPLGTLPAPSGAGASHGVVAIFYDTSDRLGRDFGIAGSFGTVSDAQKQAILAEVERQKAGRPKSDPYAEPWYVLFGHHPYDEMTSAGQTTLTDLISSLDRADRHCGGKWTEDCGQPRVLAMITAHTHTAESHRHCVGHRLVREIVVGSVIDPPEQASLVEIGLDSHGHAALRLSTLPTVARPGLVCAANHALDAGVCQRAMGRLAAAPACQELVRGLDADGASNNSCDSLERPLSVEDQINGIVLHGGPSDPKQVKALDNKRARALLSCVCRDVVSGQVPGCAELARPLKDEHYFPIIRALAEDPAHQDEVACLAWAASSLQAHKATGMTMSDAIRCAFDDPTLPAAQVSVATSEDVACH